MAITRRESKASECSSSTYTISISFIFIHFVEYFAVGIAISTTINKCTCVYCNSNDSRWDKPLDLKLI